MVTTNNKKENMVNNEQENYTGEPQEEGFFAKNKSIVLIIVALCAVAGLWAISNSGKESAAPAAAKENKSSVTDHLNSGWTYFKTEKPTWLGLAGATAGVTAFVAVAKRSKRLQNLAERVKKVFERKAQGPQAPLQPE